MFKILPKCRIGFLAKLNRANRNALGQKYYHSDGVYGYKAKKKRTYEVPQEHLQSRIRQSNLYRFVTAYRDHGHKDADVNPVAFDEPKRTSAELNPESYGLSPSDKVAFEGILNIGAGSGRVAEAVDFLKVVYSSSIGAEFQYLQSEEERDWFAERLERLPFEKLEEDSKIKIGIDLLKSQAFDKFLANKFPGLKRYGSEGAESMMCFFNELFRISARDHLDQVVVGMPHRGRLNVLTGLLNFPPAKLFRKLKGLPDFPGDLKATGDVVSHLISSTDLNINGRSLHVSVLYNPSHLEAVNPVSMGKTRAKQMMMRDGDYSQSTRWSDKILNLQVHGDAAYIGQGVNQECLVLCETPHFEIGGSVHLVVNNQIGFTTPANRGRSSRYCTDLAKIIGAPVIHVNGDRPEMVVMATRVAAEYQRKFRRDVFVDMNCYRQWGHNELDDPTFTNPALYAIIHSRKTVPDAYAEKLVKENLLSSDAIDEIVRDYTEWLSAELKQADAYQPEYPCFKKQWTGIEQAPNALTAWDTGLDFSLLQYVAQKSVAYPSNFNIHPNLLKSHVQARLMKVFEGTKIDWATAEAMAFGSLLHEGYNVRISGQDVGRGTFSHRHIMMVDQKKNTMYIPLNNMDDNPRNGHLEIANSILAEEAVLGFEYGMSIESPKNLIIWEAQFGDFFNGAQIMFDTFVSSGEAKWLWSSGLVCLLPHGYDGAGPEHSSSRIERFLQLTDSKENKPDGDDVNIHIVYPSTPAQYFHLLRRQMLRNFRKPLIIIGPKTLLRLSAAVSSYDDMKPGTTFKPVIGDELVNPKSVQKVILCSGKHYYNLADQRKTLGIDNAALVRVESLCPFPVPYLLEELGKYPNAKQFIWSQEEPQNMGAWSFIKPRFENMLGKRLRYVGRDTLPVPAVGIGQWHQQQTEDVIKKPFNLIL